LRDRGVAEEREKESERERARERERESQKWRRMEIGPWRLALGGRESLPGAIEDVKLDKPKSRGRIELRM